MKAGFVKDWRVDRLNVLAYGLPGSGKTHFGATFPRPLFVDPENGLLTLRSEGSLRPAMLDIPFIQPETWADIVAFVGDPKGVVSTLLNPETAEWMQSIVFDTVTFVELMCMEEILGRKEEPDIAEYRQLFHKMSKFFSKVWHMPYHTVLLAHADPGREGMLMKGRRVPAVAPGPTFTGRMRTAGPALSDIFLYFRAERGMQESGQPTFRAYLEEHVDGYPARTRLRAITGEPWIEDPSYEKLKVLVDKLKEETTT